MTPTYEMSKKNTYSTLREREITKLPDFPEPLTLREQAAIAAMQGILAANSDEYGYMMTESYKDNEPHTLPIGIARFATACADALIKELNLDKG